MGEIGNPYRIPVSTISIILVYPSNITDIALFLRNLDVYRIIFSRTLLSLRLQRSLLYKTLLKVPTISNKSRLITFLLLAVLQFYTIQIISISNSSAISINLSFLAPIYYQGRRLQLFASPVSRFEITISSILLSISSKAISRYALDFEQSGLFSFFRIIILAFLKNLGQYPRLKQAQNSLVRESISYRATYLRNLLEIPEIPGALSIIGYIITFITSLLLILSSIDTSIRYRVSRILSRLAVRVGGNSTLFRASILPSKLVYLTPLQSKITGNYSRAFRIILRSRPYLVSF